MFALALAAPLALVRWLPDAASPPDVAADLPERATYAEGDRCPFHLYLSTPVLWPDPTAPARPSAAHARPRVFVHGGVSVGGLGPYRSVALLSEDGGASWREVMPTTPGSDVSELAVVGAEGWALVAFGVESPGPVDVWHTADAGRTWAHRAAVAKRNPIATVRDLTFSDARRGALVVDSDGLDETPPAERQETEDGGRTWHVVGPAPVRAAAPLAPVELPVARLVRFKIEKRPGFMLERRETTTSPWREIARLPKTLRRLRDGRFAPCTPAR